MNTGIKERALQLYVKENPSKFQREIGQKIIRVDDNNDRFPDLHFTLADGRRIPIEVEWRTSNFKRHGHSLNVIIDGEGFVLVCEDDEPLGYDVKPIKIDIEAFEEWFQDHSLRLIQQTTAPYKNSKSKQKQQKLLFTYLSLKAGGVSDFQLALKHHTWGVQKNYANSVINLITEVHPGDLVAFIGPGKKFPGRVDLKTWNKKSFKGMFEQIQVFRITSDYIFDEKNIIWHGTGKWKNEVFPHRFKFDPNPVIKAKNILVNKLSPVSKKELHSTVYGNFVSVSPSTLVDILHNSE